jgi:uncharacterized Rmd1/YagE family protein
MKDKKGKFSQVWYLSNDCACLMIQNNYGMIAERFLACQRQKRLQNTIIIFRLGNVVRWGMGHGAWA